VKISDKTLIGRALQFLPSGPKNADLDRRKATG
jgi:hypothetical protein